jgi:autotransporter-associated beta strand protein
LILNGGTFSANSSTASSTDRLFTLTANGGTISNAGSGPVSYTSTGGIAMSGVGSRTLTLQIDNALITQDNVFSPQFGNAGTGPNSLKVARGGKWVITNAGNSYTGDTVLAGGELKLGASGVIPDMSRLSLTDAGGTFNLNGFDETVRTLYGPSGTSGTIQLGSKTLTVANPSGETFRGFITGSGGRFTKAGSGALTLTALNSYTGDTTVQAGTLSITERYLSDTADVRLSTGSTLDLNFGSADTIRSLFIDGVSQLAGTWGGLSSTATHKSSLITGIGLLQVTTQPTGITGDFNNNGVVEAGDYVVWSKRKNTNNALYNDNGLGVPVGLAHYALWRANFGHPAGSGSVAPASVPEAGSVLLFLIGSMMIYAGRALRAVR